MSWSVQAIGKAPAVAKKLATDFEKITHCSPEETAVKNSAAAAISMALQHCTAADAIVNVNANGSESSGQGGKTNSLKIEVNTIFGFLDDPKPPAAI
jgi:hypothetical protein